MRFLSSASQKKSPGRPVKLLFILFKLNITFYFKSYDCRTYENNFRLFDNSGEKKKQKEKTKNKKNKAFDLKVKSKELRLIFVHHVNTECT